jgi:hypothetical protein
MIRKANRPKTDADGRITVKIAQVEEKMVQDVKKMKKGLAPDACEYEAVDFTFTMEGTNGEFEITERAGSVVNSEPASSKYRGKTKMYNKFTTIMLSTGLLTVETLDTFDADQLHKDMLNLVGTVLNVQLFKNENFYQMDVASLKPLDK